MSKDTKHFLKSEVLNYLEKEKKYNGQKDFITYIDFQVDDGKASMWQYELSGKAVQYTFEAFLWCQYYYFS